MKTSLSTITVLTACSIAAHAATFNFDTLANQPANDPSGTTGGPVLGTTFTTSNLGRPVNYTVIGTSGEAEPRTSRFARDFVTQVNGNPMFAPSGGFDSLNVTGFTGRSVIARINSGGATGPQLALASIFAVNANVGGNAVATSGQGIVRVRAYTGTVGNSTLLTVPWTIEGGANGFTYTSDSNGAGASGTANSINRTGTNSTELVLRNTQNITATPDGTFNNTRMLALTSPGLQYDFLEVEVDYTGITGPVVSDEIQVAFGLQVIPEPSTALLGALSAGLLFRRRR